MSFKHLLWTPNFAADDLCEDEDDFEDNVAEDGEGGKLYINLVSNIIFWIYIFYFL